MLATSGAKVSVGVADGSIASLNVTVTVNLPAPTSASVISQVVHRHAVTLGLTVSIDDGVGSCAAQVEGRVGVAARRNRDRAGSGEAVSRGDRRGVMRGVDLAQRAADQREAGRDLDVGFGEAGARRLAEREGHHRAGVAVVQRAVDDVDRDGRVLRCRCRRCRMPPVPGLPAASVKLPAATATVPLAMMSWAAVTVAV